MAHPDWVLKHKQKNTEIRNIRGRYYLYKITSKWDPSKKRTKKVTLGMLGVITEQDGFIPKGVTKKGRPPKFKAPMILSTKEYGATFLLQTLAPDIIDALKECFPNDWENLLVLSLNRLLYQAPLKRCEFLFEESFLSETFKKVDLRKNTLTALIQDIGSDRQPIVKFLKTFIEGTEHIIFDATSIISNASCIEAAQKGYSSQKGYDSYVNLFYMFNTDKKEPNYYRIFPGNIQGTSALKNCLQESGIKEMIAIGDKGFCSKNNLQLLEESSLQYILPLKRDIYQNAFDGHFIYQGRVIFYTSLPETTGKKVIIFTDKSLALEEEKTYLKRIEDQFEGYTMEGYQEKQIKFGTISMITNCLHLSEEHIYSSYKTRMEIETVFDTYKNLLEADRTYMHSDKSLEAWIFINHLATMFYYRVFNLLKTHDLLKKISPADLFARTMRINKIKINDQWVTSEINLQTKKLLHKLNLPVT